MDEKQKNEQTNESQNPEKEPTNEKIKEENPNQEQSIEEKEEQEVKSENQEQIMEETEKPDVIEENNEKSLVAVKKKRKKRKGSYISGTIGAILGGLVAIIPWMLTYIFADNMVIPLFGALIPLGAFLGYKIFRGKVKKAFPVIITIISIIIIVLLTTIVCPTILLLESGYPITWDNIIGLYSDTREDVRTVIIEDLVAGLAFTIMGIVLTIMAFIRKHLSTEEERIALHEEAKKQLQEKSDVLKQVCENLNCMNSENAVKKKVIFKELKNTHNLKRKKRKQYFSDCKAAKLLRKHKGKYYYDENGEPEKLEMASKIKFRRKIKKTIKVIILIAVIVALVTGVIWIINEMFKPAATLAGTGILVEIDEATQDYYGTDVEITNEFGEEAAVQCDFVLLDKEEKYEVNGKAVPKEQFEGEDLSSILEANREYYVQLLGEENVSEIEDKQFGEPNIKSYTYSYLGVDGNQHSAIVYLCEATKHYVWASIYADPDVTVEQMDRIIDNFIK